MEVLGIYWISTPPLRVIVMVHEFCVCVLLVFGAGGGGLALALFVVAGRPGADFVYRC